MKLKSKGKVITEVAMFQAFHGYPPCDSVELDYNDFRIIMQDLNAEEKLYDYMQYVFTRVEPCHNTDQDCVEPLQRAQEISLRDASQSQPVPETSLPAGTQSQPVLGINPLDETQYQSAQEIAENGLEAHLRAGSQY